jgi:thiol-disulfide isomerase/thioredoxin
MRNLAILIILCAVILGIGYAIPHIMKPTNDNIDLAMMDEQVQNFEFQSLGGDHHALHDFTGNPVMVHFWATWCAPCVVEFPELVQFAINNPNVTIIAVSSDTETDKIDHFLNQYVSNHPPNMIIVHDVRQTITQDRFGTFQLPETYILDSDLVLTEKIIGAYKDWDTFQFLP